MAPEEYFGWEQHLLRYPPGDYHTQKILAEIWAILVSFFSGQTHSFLNVAPWLEDPDVRIERMREVERTAEVQKTQRAAAAFQELFTRQKKDQDAS